MVPGFSRSGRDTKTTNVWRRERHGHKRELAGTFRLPLRASGRSPLHPFFTTEHDFVWCLPPGPFWWSDALTLVRWTLYLAVATEATQQGGSLRLLPPPKVQPHSFLLSDALEIDAADGAALRRVRRLFLGYAGTGTPTMAMVTRSNSVRTPINNIYLAK